MIKFIGEYTAKVDDKGRLVLPSAFKNRIAAGADGKSPNAMKLIVRKETYAECLAQLLQQGARYVLERIYEEMHRSGA